MHFVSACYNDCARSCTCLCTAAAAAAIAAAAVYQHNAYALQFVSSLSSSIEQNTRGFTYTCTHAYTVQFILTYSCSMLALVWYGMTIYVVLAAAAATTAAAVCNYNTLALLQFCFDITDQLCCCLCLS